MALEILPPNQILETKEPLPLILNLCSTTALSPLPADFESLPRILTPPSEFWIIRSPATF